MAERRSTHTTSCTNSHHIHIWLLPHLFPRHCNPSSAFTYCPSALSFIISEFPCAFTFNSLSTGFLISPLLKWLHLWSLSTELSHTLDFHMPSHIVPEHWHPQQNQLFKCLPTWSLSKLVLAPSGLYTFPTLLGLKSDTQRDSARFVRRKTLCVIQSL